MGDVAVSKAAAEDGSRTMCKITVKESDSEPDLCMPSLSRSLVHVTCTHDSFSELARAGQRVSAKSKGLERGRIHTTQGSQQHTKPKRTPSTVASG